MHCIYYWGTTIWPLLLRWCPGVWCATSLSHYDSNYQTNKKMNPRVSSVDSSLDNWLWAAQSHSRCPDSGLLWVHLKPPSGREQTRSPLALAASQRPQADGGCTQEARRLIKKETSSSRAVWYKLNVAVHAAHAHMSLKYLFMSRFEHHWVIWSSFVMIGATWLTAETWNNTPLL